MTAKAKTAKAAPVERKLETLTLKLATPIRDGGEVIREVTVTEPLSFQTVNAWRAAEGGTVGRVMIALIGQISTLTPDQAKKLKVRDVGRISVWLRKLTSDALEADGVKKSAIKDKEPDPFAIEPEVADTELTTEEIDALDDRREFTLLAPFEHEGRRYETVTAVEPSIETMETASKFKLEAETTVALVAGVVGLTIPEVNRMAQRDIARVEAWLGPFVQEMIGPTIGGI